jgi:DNA-binding response OmpR family regulator
MRILVVEDDSRIAEPVANALRGQRHTVEIAQSGDAGLALCDAEAHDLVVLDVMLPGVSGLEICRSLRKRGSRTMILMMTARDAVSDKVLALDEGADDYVVKPFDLEELLARIRALSRRGSEGRSVVLRRGRLELDQAASDRRVVRAFPNASFQQ